MGSQPPSPPVVTLNCPGEYDIVGASRIFTATVNQAATITFFFDGNQVMTSSGTTAPYTATAEAAGLHTIRVTAQNANGSSEVICNWFVAPAPLVVTLEDPSSSIVMDPPNTPRCFTARANQPATISFYLDGSQTPATQSSPDVTEATFCGSAPGHLIQVVASNANENANNYWNWYVLYNPPPVTVVSNIGPFTNPDGQVIQCNNTTEYAALIINNAFFLTYSNETYALLFNIEIGCGGLFFNDHSYESCTSSLVVTITRDVIEDPNEPPEDPITCSYIVNCFTPSINTPIPVPLSTGYTITCHVDCSCTGWTRGEIDEEGHIIAFPYREAASSSAECSIHINIPQ